jgi:uncharacterized protein (TIGR02271 family)
MSHPELPADRPLDPSDERVSSDATMVRREEELQVGTEEREAGSVRIRKSVESVPVEQTVERSIEHADVERLSPAEGDPGEVVTLPDGSVSIPIFEEELVVTKRMVVRERVIVRKSTVTDEHVVEAELKRERIDVEADPAVEDSLHRETAEETRTPSGDS